MSGVLLDTHALVWLMFATPTLGPKSRDLARDARPADSLFVSAVSFWELAMLTARSRVLLYQPAREWRREVLESGIIEVPLSGSIGILAAELDGFHRDPADRIITATAMEAGATLVTADERLLTWRSTLPRHDART